MTRERRRGFIAGLLTAAIAVGLCGAALAAGRSIEIDDGIAVTINGVPFTPRDATGREVPLFSYNGTTYAPIRAFSKAAGLTVGYDAATQTARIETPEYAAAADPSAGEYITVERAKEICLADAGVAASDAFFLRSHLDWEDGRAVYDVEFCCGAKEYDYELSALTGAVLEKDLDCEDYDWAGREDYHTTATGAAVTAERAKELALIKLPGATVRKCELDWDDGRWEYELELWKDGLEYECKIDGTSGQILKWEQD